MAKPDTILAWYRKLVAHKFDSSKARRGPGRPRVTRKVEQLIVRLAEENRDWGYDRIAGALANLGYRVCDQTVGNVLQRPARAAGAGAQAHDHLVGVHSRPLGAAGGHRLLHRGGAHSARAHDLLRAIFHPSREPPGGHRRDHHPSQRTMDEANGTKRDHGRMRDPTGLRYLLHDRDTKFTQSFRAIIASGQVEPLALRARSPNLNAYAERWVRSVKEECLSKVILFGERSLRRALGEYVGHYHEERNHQGKGNVLLFPRNRDLDRERRVRCRERLGGLLRYYHQEAA